MILIPGHPQPKPPTAPLSASLAISLTADEKAAVSAAAKAAGLSMSAWGRQAITTTLRSAR